ncbi:FtsX-like permease family protein [Herbaspirillum sp. RTI4]|uniref:ABC transporter permease n=1 Tax=Herbaspirillum sp. RTI4 TaxID=3048640 RepID=UPI002AB4D738|nr:FtsX-like permease family protein [Herbaspirillum sp. RTI4]MDY7579233.1 FtsX-like permease family protein [Herbaspirillum sp. RTI4]MEA9982634.1 FtsX-like permease family protein [Herbaspirillum sp. RTI4]
MFLLSLRMTARDWRAGELRFLLMALVVAVAALSSVGFFVDRMRAGLTRDAHQLLGADLLVAADQPIAAAWRTHATQLGLHLADTVVFPSMATAGSGDASRSLLASLKAVSPTYPLRGTLKTSDQPGGAEQSTTGIPAPGTVWIDPALLTPLHLVVGDTLTLGERPFRITRILTLEPDRGNGFINFAPRVLLPLSDLGSTQLVQVGSRLTYRLLLSGSTTALADYQQWLETRIAQEKVRGVRIENLENGRPEMRATLDRAEQFLALVGLLSALLAAVAVAMAARRFMLRHIDACAMLRCLGMTQNQASRLFVSEFLLVGLAGSAVGVAVGFGAHFALLAWLGKFLPTALPAAGWLPAVQGLAVGMLLLIGFALPPLLQLRGVPHNRVLRREAHAPQALTLLTYALGTAVFVGLLLWQAGDVKLGLLTAAGFLGACGAFSLLGWLALKALKSVRRFVPNAGWRFALTALQRRPGASIMQIVALSLGLMALLLLTVIRGDLIGAWRQSTPADAPNRFVINIQTEQKASMEARLKAAHIPAQLSPMMRGRLLAINGVAVNAASYPEARAQQLVEREFNLSTMTALPAGNAIVAGRWYDDSKPEASVEQGLAKTLNMKLGDRLQFDIGGQTVSATVTSLRKLDWGSLRVNFFVIINPRAMADMPQTWITSFHLPPAQAALAEGLTRDFPNLTVVDIGTILKQIQDVVDQVVAAVEFLFLFTLASGVLVLYAALIASQSERIAEAGLLRALGATRKQLAQAQRIEFLVIGTLAGIFAASGAAAIGWALARYVFDFEWHFSPLVWLSGAVIGAVCALAGGWFGLRQVLNRPPLQTLREV